jgi:hypothetical protein
VTSEFRWTWSRGISVRGLGLASAEGQTQRQRNAFLDVESPGALYHELERVALSFGETLDTFQIELKGPLKVGEEL